ncbi:MAG TPA: hypothetical protein VGM30_20075 [Puia sp.]|jgi:hypothetical protein
MENDSEKPKGETRTVRLTSIQRHHVNHLLQWEEDSVEKGLQKMPLRGGLEARYSRQIATLAFEIAGERPICKATGFPVLVYTVDLYNGDEHAGHFFLYRVKMPGSETTHYKWIDLTFAEAYLAPIQEMQSRIEGSNPPF